MVRCPHCEFMSYGPYCHWCGEWMGEEDDFDDDDEDDDFDNDEMGVDPEDE